jgi:NTP pyrophosphatase (non-canonical NTP hydrolase)
MGARMTLEELRRANEARQAEWPGSESADLAFRALEVAGEAGEAMNLVKKLLRAERGIKGNSVDAGQLRQELADELADVQISLDLLAMKAGIDLAGSTVSKFNRTSEKHGLATRLPCSVPTRGTEQRSE